MAQLHSCAVLSACPWSEPRLLTFSDQKILGRIPRYSLALRCYSVMNEITAAPVVNESKTPPKLSESETESHPKTLLRERGFSLGVLIASCTENSNLEYKTPKRCVSPLRQRLAVVKWYRIDADWYKPDPTRLADR